MKRFIVLFFTLAFMAPNPVSAFTDTDNSPYEEAILFLREEGIVEGYSDGTYRPFQSINRAEFTKIAMESLRSDSQGEYCFADIQTQWFARYICEAQSRGVVSGYPDGYFRPGDEINLVESLKIVFEAHSLPIQTNEFEWYDAYMNYAYQHGLLSGIDETLDHFISRGEMAQLIYNVKILLGEEDIFSDQANSSTPLALKSDYFKKQFGSFDQDIDLAGLEMFSENDTGHSKAYQIAGALYMLGYSFDSPDEPNLAIHLLNDFQRKNGFRVSSVLTRDLLLEVDRQLALFEPRFANYADKFDGLFNNTIPGIEENIFPKDFIAWVFLYPLESLPSKFQIHSYTEMKFCLVIQCTGSIVEEGNEVFFQPDIFYPSDHHAFPQPLGSQVMVMIHEYAHYFDGFSGFDLLPVVNADYPHRYIIPTDEFSNIGYIFDKNRMIIQESRGFQGDTIYAVCFPLKTGQEGFIAYYGYDGYPNLENECPEGMSHGRSEDFAMSMQYYVGAGEFFRAAATKNSFIEERYNWLKINVFNGIEYNTDLRDTNVLYSGCLDSAYGDSHGPGYVSCDNDYIWNKYLTVFQ